MWSLSLILKDSDESISFSRELFFLMRYEFALTMESESFMFLVVVESHLERH